LEWSNWTSSFLAFGHVGLDAMLMFRIGVSGVCVEKKKRSLTSTRFLCRRGCSLSSVSYTTANWQLANAASSRARSCTTRL
jgi:hypothetical protein